MGSKIKLSIMQCSRRRGMFVLLALFGADLQAIHGGVQCARFDSEARLEVADERLLSLSSLSSSSSYGRGVGRRFADVVHGGSVTVLVERRVVSSAVREGPSGTTPAKLGLTSESVN